MNYHSNHRSRDRTHPHNNTLKIKAAVKCQSIGLKVWEMAALEAGITPASRNVWEGHQWERDPPSPLLPLSSIPVPCRAAAVSLLGPSGQLLTRCAGSSTSADESLIPGSNCGPTRCSQNVRGVLGGDRYNVRASVILLDAVSVDEPSHYP